MSTRQIMQVAAILFLALWAGTTAGGHVEGILSGTAFIAMVLCALRAWLAPCSTPLSH